MSNNTYYVAPSRDKSHHTLISVLESNHGWKRINTETNKVKNGKKNILKKQQSAQEEAETANLARPSTSAVAGSGFYIGGKQGHHVPPR
jgi:hypothetical protein